MDIKNSELMEVLPADLKQVDSHSPLAFICPKEVKAINEHAFDKVRGLVGIVENVNVERIKPNTFSNCVKLKQVKFVKDEKMGQMRLNYIDDCAFWGCNSLEKFVVPEGVVGLGRYVFANCSNLKELDLPYSLKKIVEKPIYNCSNFSKVTIHGETDNIANRFLWFKNDEINGIKGITSVPCSKKLKIHIPNDHVAQLFWDRMFRYDPFTYSYIWLANSAKEFEYKGLLRRALENCVYRKDRKKATDTYNIVIGTNKPANAGNVKPYYPKPNKPNEDRSRV